MSNTPKVHWIRKNAWHSPNMPKPVLCGTGATFTTDDEEKVMCQTCKRLLEDPRNK